MPGCSAVQGEGSPVARRVQELAEIAGRQPGAAPAIDRTWVSVRGLRAAGRVRVDGEPVEDLDQAAPTPARIVLAVD